MPFTFATSGAILVKAGAYGLQSGAVLLQLSDEAEALLNGIMRVDAVAIYSGLGANLRNILQDGASSYGGMMVINHDMSLYPDLALAQTQLNLLRDNFTRIVDIIKDDKWKSIAGVT